MTTRHGLGDDVPPIKNEAMNWASLFAIGLATEEDCAAFERWRESSPAHRDAYRIASEFLDELRAIDFPRHLPQRPEANDNGHEQTVAAPSINRRAFLGGSAIAASIAAGVIAAQSPLGLWPTLSELLADERTGRGERRTLTPMAGVTIEMNGRSSLSRMEQGVRLIAGEIFVGIKEARHPVQVATSEVAMSTRSARFNVNALETGL